MDRLEIHEAAGPLVRDKVREMADFIERSIAQAVVRNTNVSIIEPDVAGPGDPIIALKAVFQDAPVPRARFYKTKDAAPEVRALAEATLRGERPPTSFPPETGGTSVNGSGNLNMPRREKPTA